MKTVASGNVTVSSPYDALNAAALVPYQSNTTEVILAELVGGARYATLTVEGSWAGDGQGPSVAEWAVISEGAGVAGNGSSVGSRKRKVEIRR